MQAVVNILRTMGAATVAAIQTDIEKVSVTGKSAKKVRMVVESTQGVDMLIIYGPTYIETGRGPRKSSEESDFQDNLEEWIEHRTSGLNDKQKQRLARYLRLKINREGDETWKKGGRIVYHDTVVKAANAMKAAVAKDFKIKFSNFVKNAVNGNISS